MPFGQIVLGPPGSGKTTYCRGMQQFMQATGRKVAIVNLDPANDMLPYEAAVDISELVCVEEVMAELKLGPNGGLLYCMDYLAKNLDWLRGKLEPLEKDDFYFLFDCPGQVELFAAPGGGALRAVLAELTGEGGGGGASGGEGSAGGPRGSYRLVAVQLVDTHLCIDPAKYISALLLSLNTMLYLELPHINVLSKMDLVQQYGKLDFNLEFYTEVQDLGFLVHTMGGKPFSQKFRKLSQGLCEVVQEYGLVSFLPFAIQDKESLKRLTLAADKANGYCFATLRGHTPYPPEILYGSAAGGISERDMWLGLQEKYLDGEVTETPPARPAGWDGAAGQGGLQGAAAAAGALAAVEEEEENEEDDDGGREAQAVRVGRGEDGMEVDARAAGPGGGGEAQGQDGG